MVGQSLCGEGRAIRPHYYQLTRPTTVAELWTVTADTAVQALKNHIQFIALYVGATYMRVYAVFMCHLLWQKVAVFIFLQRLKVQIFYIYRRL